MIEARDGCTHLLSLPDIGSHLEHCIGTGIAVSYARPFTANQGMAPLSAKFHKFPEQALETLHLALLEARNMVYGHTDVITQPTHLSIPLSLDERSRIGIVVTPEGNGKWFIRRPSFSREMFTQIANLCEFQKNRIHEASTNMLTHLHKDKSYRPGEYILGETFP
jgi:hypothetical protein